MSNVALIMLVWCIQVPFFARITITILSAIGFLAKLVLLAMLYYEDME